MKFNEVGVLDQTSIDYLVKEYNLKFIVLFGSYTKGYSWSGSDIDLGFLAEKRLTQHKLEDFVIDIMSLTGIEKVNAIDLYFDDENSQIGKKKLSLIQLEIYLTGRLLYEKRKGSFEEMKVLATSQSMFKNKDTKKLIIEDKLKFLEQLIAKLKSIKELQSEEYAKRIAAGKKEESELYYYLDAAATKIALDMVKTAIGLNRFILNEYYGSNPQNSYESFMKLELTGLFNEKYFTPHLDKKEDIQKRTDESYYNRSLKQIPEKEFYKLIAKTAALTNFQTIDYFWGSSWSLRYTIENMCYLYPKYVEIMKEFVMNQK